MLLALFFSVVAFINSFIPQAALTEGLIGQPKSLNVLDLGTNQSDRDIARFIHRGLMKYDAQGNLVPDLAESYKVSDDKKEYTFILKKNLHWHNGKLFTSDDVIYTVSKLNLQSVAVDKLDQNSVRFRLARDPYAPFLDIMTQYLLSSNYRGEEKSGLNQIGIGDFRIARVVKSNKVDSVILTPAWPWIKNEYKFSKIIFKFYSNTKDLETGANLGEVSSFGSPTIGKDFGNFNKISAAIGARSYALYLNTAKEILKDKSLRQYLAFLTNKTEVVDELFQGQAVVSNSPLEYTFVNPDEALSNRKKPPFIPKTDPELKLTITVPKPSNTEPGFYLSLAEIIKKSWETGGVIVAIREVPLDKIFTEIIGKKDFEVLLFGQEASRDPDVYSLWHTTQKDLPGLNFTSFTSVLADRSLETGRRESDPATRLKTYLNFLKVFNDEVPAIFLYHPLYNYYFRKDITGPNLQGFFFTADRFSNFEDWKRN